MDLILLFIVVAVVSYAVIVWNLLLPLPGSQNREFVGYLFDMFHHNYDSNAMVQQYVDGPVVSPIKEKVADLTNNTEIKFERYELGPQVHNGGAWHNVTLTFYVEYGNSKYLPDLLDLLYKYKIPKAVFFVNKTFAKENPIMIKRIQYDGYVVRDLQTFGEYDKSYYPTVFGGTILDDKEVLNKSKNDRDASSFMIIASRYYNSSILAFSPKIMPHKAMLETLLKHNKIDVVFTDDKVGSAQKAEDHNVEAYAEAETDDPILEYLNFTTKSGTVLPSGNWTMDSIESKYPSTVRFLPQHGAYLILKPILVGKGAAVDMTNERILLLSTQQQKRPSAILEVKGGLVETGNTTITSYDPFLGGADPNGYHPRPFILVRDGGKMDLYNSTVSYLGYSLGGFEDTRFSRAAIAYYNTTNVNIGNSVLAHNYYGFYSAHTNGIRIVGSQVFGNIRYGLDPHTYSWNLYVAGNHIYDNGNQGFICSLHCLNVTVIGNVVEHNVEGIGIHWLTNSSVIKDNIVRYNAKYGIFVQKGSFDNIVTNNTVIGNKYGIGLLDNSAGNQVVHNILADNVLEQIKMDSSAQPNTVQDNTVYSSNDPSAIPPGIKSLMWRAGT